MNIAVVGTGYVGLVTGVVLAELGHAVVAVDVDVRKVECILSGDPTFYEPGLEQALGAVLANGRFTAACSVAEGLEAADIVFLAVGTPVGEDGSADLSQVFAAAAEIGTELRRPTVIAVKSTVPVGTCERVEAIARERAVRPEWVRVVSNPEFLREGSALMDARRPDRIVIGADDPSAGQCMLALYEGAECPVLVTSRRTAEVIKYASNAFLATKLSYINAVSRLCELCGADVGEVARGMGLDHRVSPRYLRAGLGWGGSCLPKDVTALIKTSEQLGYDFELLKAVERVNRDQTQHFLERIGQRLGDLAGKSLAVLGLAFKPNTDDVRSAKSLQVIRWLLDQGAAVRAHDPVAVPKMKEAFGSAEYFSDPYECLRGADAAVLVTEWREFQNLDLARVASTMRGKLLFDGRRCISRLAAERAGLEYHTVGS